VTIAKDRSWHPSGTLGGKRLPTLALFVTGILIFCGPALPRERKPPTPLPDEFLLGRRTFFDFGPPFDFYEIFSVRSFNGTTLVTRIQLTPPGDVCTQTADVQLSSASISQSIAELFDDRNPCSIPDKDLHRELKRCKNCLVFSGANVVMQVQCGGLARAIRMDVLDRDMFDYHPTTPEHTSWTMRLLGRLDQALGATIMDRPAFSLSEPSPPVERPQSAPMIEALAEGKFDVLFPRGSAKPSELFQQSQNPPPPPSVELTSSSPFHPASFTLPQYSAIARIAHLSGQVTFAIQVAPGGKTSSLTFLSGNPILQKAVALSVQDWIFPPEAAGKKVEAAIEFKMNCVSNRR
jgi:hypothetical protein